MSIRVRQAVIEDIGLIAELFDAYRVFYGQPSDVEGARQFLFDRTVHRQSTILVAVDEAREGRFVGFTQLYPLFSSVSMERLLLLNDLYVAESHRKQGVAQLLLDAARDYARTTKAKGLELSTAIDNAAAQRLYERNGFERDEDFYHYFLSTKG
ncbi:GNAT superfamily N-acetyltransferase [Paenibacillus phyllosphaerae]|uniref:GNAT superfamily N-acetyltransferase n=1 Tax=Paenibacillus phyllosphaerae TaxID=274593 RepID=A0A7W5AWG2_9BACL|nr:GNAT family N-acetyltransferase [Paenibacillus phyllosphaerae]MBB3109501.1 GNAT superfamily N-acetyltransferase [Paenibacillus phyllosphaerae]